MPVSSPRCRRDYGQTLPLVAALLVLLGALTAVVIETAVILDDRAQARTAADAAALAGAVDGETAARELAARNGARLEEYALEDGEVTVVVRVGRARARARAATTPIFEEPRPIP